MNAVQLDSMKHVPEINVAGRFPSLWLDDSHLSPHAPTLLQIEKEEEKVAQQDPDKQCFHLCIVNLVIGTLYCAKVSRTTQRLATTKYPKVSPYIITFPG